MRKLTKEEYLENQAKFVADNNLKIGSKVRVKSVLDLEPFSEVYREYGSLNSPHWGWNNSWEDGMSKNLGKEVTIRNILDIGITFEEMCYSYPYYMLESGNEEEEVFKKESDGFVSINVVNYKEFTVDTLAPELLGILYSRGTNLDLIEKVTFTVINNKETVCNIFFKHVRQTFFDTGEPYILAGRSKLNKGEEYNSVIGNTLAFARALNS